MLRVVSGNTNYPISLTSLRQYLKHQDDDDLNEIAEIEAMLAACVTFIEKKTGLILSSKTLKEIFYYDDSEEYNLSARPIFSVDSVTYTSLDGTETALTLNSDYYLRGDYIKQVITCYMTNSGTLSVQYKAGYGDDDTELCPSDIMLAIKNQCFQWYENRDLYREMSFNNQVQNIISSYSIIF